MDATTAKFDRVDRRFDKIDEKLDKLIRRDAMVVGATMVISFLVSIGITVLFGK